MSHRWSYRAMRCLRTQAPFMRTVLASILLIFASNVLAAGNIEVGKQLTYTCAGCHGIVEYKNAYPQYNVPRIAGQNETYLINALKEYKSHERKHPTMRAQAGSFSDEDIANIAAYLSSIDLNEVKK
jgi:cytochrome c553